MSFLELLGAILAFLITIVVIYLMKGRGVLEKLGLPVVPPFLIFGSPPFFVNRLMFHEFINDQFKKYGKTWATYLGVQPTVMTIDPGKHLSSFEVPIVNTFSPSLLVFP